MSRLLVTALLIALSIPAPCAFAEQERPESEVGNWAAPSFWTPARTASARSALAAPPPPLPFFAITPCRVADTRGNGFTGAFGLPFMPSSASRDFPIAGQCGIPAAAQAVSFNFTVANAAGPGFLLVAPQGGALPLVSTLNYLLVQTVANAAIVQLGVGGGITAAPGVSGIDLIIDVNGYYAPTGIVDTLNGLTGDVQLAAGADISVGSLGQTLTVSALSATGNSPNTLVKRDGSGNFGAGTITAALNGNAATATSATTATTATTATFATTAGSATTAATAATATFATTAGSATTATTATTANSATTAAFATTAASATNFIAPLAGDVTGPQGTTLVTALRGFPVSPAPPGAPGSVLTWGGASWAAAPPAAAFTPAWAQLTSAFTQIYPIGGTVTFETIGGVSGISCLPFGCTLTVSGTYQIDFSAQASTSNGYDLTANGVSIPGSIFGSASDVVRGRVLATLPAGTVISLRALGFTFLDASLVPGANSASLQILQIAP